ncbi:Ctf8-domain-containing protein [Cubamyces lactineus]|nr:Ctf8-domain-containing protein [Cubamyces lactineus]
MLIPINVAIPDPSSAQRKKLPPQLVQFGTDELVLIDLQGALDVEGNKDGQLVGKLRIDPATKKPTLLIGHHLLEGKLVTLPRPLGVLHRHDPAQTGGSASMDVDESGQSSNGSATSWDIVAVVKRKMVFSKRPMPIVGKPCSSIGAPLSRIGSKP